MVKAQERQQPEAARDRTDALAAERAAEERARREALIERSAQAEKEALPLLESAEKTWARSRVARSDDLRTARLREAESELERAERILVDAPGSSTARRATELRELVSTERVVGAALAAATVAEACAACTKDATCLDLAEMIVDAAATMEDQQSLLALRRAREMLDLDMSGPSNKERLDATRAKILAEEVRREVKYFKARGDGCAVVQIGGDAQVGTDRWCAAGLLRKSLIEGGLLAERVVVSATPLPAAPEAQHLPASPIDVRLARDEELVVDADAACRGETDLQTRTWVHPVEQARREASAKAEAARAEENARLLAEAPQILSDASRALGAGHPDEAEQLILRLAPIRDSLPALGAIEKKIDAAKVKAAKEAQVREEMESALVEFNFGLSEATRLGVQRKAIEAIHRDGTNPNARGLWAQWQRFLTTWRSEGCSELKVLVKRFGEAKVRKAVRDRCEVGPDVDCSEGIPGWQHPDEVTVCNSKHCTAALALLPCW